MFMTNISPKKPVFSNGKHFVTYGYMAPEYGRAHRGTDLVPGAVGIDSAIVSIEDGIVESIKDSVRNTLDIKIPSNWQHPDVTGNVINIRHNDRFISKYCHLAFGSIRIKAGQRVSRGQIIAAIGNTGLSTAPHLHFEIVDSGNRVDPFPYLMGTIAFETSKINYSSALNNIDQIAKRVIAGEFGVGSERVERLSAAGHDPKAVQSRVNDILGASAVSAAAPPSLITNASSVIAAKKTIEDVAQEIIRNQGEWGNDPIRRQKLIAYGGESFRNAVQNRVNELLK